MANVEVEGACDTASSFTIGGDARGAFVVTGMLHDLHVEGDVVASILAGGIGSLEVEGDLLADVFVGTEGVQFVHVHGDFIPPDEPGILGRFFVQSSVAEFRVDGDMGGSGLATSSNCVPDYNQDGNLDQADVTCIMDDVASNPTRTCYAYADPDVNDDGNVDQDDVALMITIVSSGQCP